MVVHAFVMVNQGGSWLPTHGVVWGDSRAQELLDEGQELWRPPSYLATPGGESPPVAFQGPA